MDDTKLDHLDLFLLAKSFSYVVLDSTYVSPFGSLPVFLSVYVYWERKSAITDYEHQLRRLSY